MDALLFLYVLCVCVWVSSSRSHYLTRSPTCSHSPNLILELFSGFSTHIVPLAFSFIMKMFAKTTKFGQFCFSLISVISTKIHVLHIITKSILANKMEINSINVIIPHQYQMRNYHYLLSNIQLS